MFNASCALYYAASPVVRISSICIPRQCLELVQHSLCMRHFQIRKPERGLILNTTTIRNHIILLTVIGNSDTLTI